MTKLKTIGAIGALLLGTSTLALAQTSSTTNSGSGTNSGTTMMGQPATPPQSGSHPPMASPQNAPASRPVAGATGSTAPGPQTARMSDQDVKKRLEDAGYSSVTDVKHSKNGGYTAHAMRAGKRVTVDVDGNGQIMAK
jgi:hypothetical protein